MCSLCVLTEVMIFMTAVRRVDSIAFRTLARSRCPRLAVVLVLVEDFYHSPLSVLGSATVTRTVQVSHKTSSSPLYHIFFRRVFSMNCTDT